MPKKVRWFLVVLIVLAAGIGGFFAVQSSLASSSRPESVKPLDTSSPPAVPEIQGIQNTLAGGKPDQVQQLLPLRSGESPDPAFVDHVMKMGLVINPASMTKKAEGVWTVKATDSSGVVWEIGLVRDAGSLKIVYAEKS